MHSVGTTHLVRMAHGKSFARGFRHTHTDRGSSATEDSQVTSITDRCSFVGPSAYITDPQIVCNSAKIAKSTDPNQYTFTKNLHAGIRCGADGEDVFLQRKTGIERLHGSPGSRLMYHPTAGLKEPQVVHLPFR